MPFPSTVLVTPPTTEPITLNEAKLHCQVDHTEEDALITLLIEAARQYVEDTTNRALITQTWKVYFDYWPDYFVLPYPRLQSVTHIKYTDIAAAQTTLASTEYEVDIVREPGLIRLGYSKSWPSASLQYTNPIEVQFVAGYGAAAAVPAKVKQAMYLLIKHWYDNRYAITVGNTAAVVSSEIQLGVKALLISETVHYIS